MERGWQEPKGTKTTQTISSINNVGRCTMGPLWLSCSTSLLMDCNNGV